MPGRVKDKNNYLRGLNEVEFVSLVADILYVHFKHTDVKIMDGTGDGKRDIHSVNSKQQNCITQCKFHYDFNKTCGSSETDEITIALNKFGYKAGIFCSTGKLSPQAKREYKDNYPGFELYWMEGHEIVDIVLENPFLKEIWIKNNQLHLVNKAITIPFIVRKFPDDIQLELTEIDYKKLKKEIVHNPRKVLCSLHQFFPYRNLDARKTTTFFNNLYTDSIVVVGKSSITRLIDAKKQLLNFLRQELYFDNAYYVLRLGVPFFDQRINKNSENQKPNFNLPIAAESFVIQDNYYTFEYDWLIGMNESWREPRYIKMSQLSNFCYYNYQENITLRVYYKSSVDHGLFQDIENSIEAEKIYWSKSLFLSANIPEKSTFQSFTDIKEPDCVYPYGPNANLLCWFHPRMTFRPMNLIEFEKQLSHPEFEDLKLELKKCAHERDFEIIPWTLASKIAALSGNEPFPEKPEIEFNIVDMLETFNDIPSPLISTNRTIEFGCIWHICQQTDVDIQERLNHLDTLLAREGYLKKINVMIDDETMDNIYYRVDYKIDYAPHLSTKAICESQISQVKIVFDAIEKLIQSVFAMQKRGTKLYWGDEYGIEL